jgi:hypothetical protein
MGVASRSLVETNGRFRGAYCLHHHGDNRPDDGGYVVTGRWLIIKKHIGSVSLEQPKVTLVNFSNET